MKSTIQRVLIAVAVATLGAGAVGTASAQSSAPGPAHTPGAHHGHHHFGFGGSPFLGTFLHALHQLPQAVALSPGQESQIKSLLQGARPAHAPGTQPQGPNITVIGDPGNVATYNAAVAKAITAATNRINKDSALASEIYNTVLNNAQRGALPTLLASIEAKQQARRAQWVASHAAGNG